MRIPALVCLSFLTACEQYVSALDDRTPVPADTASPQPTSQPTRQPEPTTSPSVSPSPLPPANGLCADTNTLVCDSFETLPVGNGPDSQLWTLKIGSANDTVRIDDTRAHIGRRSLHVHTQTGAYEVADIVNKTVPAVAHNVIYGRAFIYLTQALPSTHISVVTAGSPLPNNNYAWTRYGGQFGDLMINYQPDQGTESWQHATGTTFALNQWICMQFYFNGNTTEARFWVNDVEIPHLYLNGSTADVGAPPGQWSLPSIDTITLGWEHYPSDSGTDGMDIWYDDVALDTRFIRCAQ